MLQLTYCVQSRCDPQSKRTYFGKKISQGDASWGIIAKSELDDLKREIRELKEEMRSLKSHKGGLA